ncbi:hypothetical protein VNI00_011723 [Paramarasmius palmivorus]|uniref:TPR-like protein n=1 Tax=Paramarasmius palmivorus TaxID=297713 RepID=A0AAW0CFV1_9AGAR
MPPKPKQLKQSAQGELKAEADALFFQGDFTGAIEKYTEAIALDEENAFLYSNRSAAYFNLHEYGEAAQDAAKATDINPKYFKAWARLAKAKDALRQPWYSKIAWQKAVDTLPTSQLSADEKRFRVEYRNGLLAALQSHLSMAGDQTEPAVYEQDERHSMPWMLSWAYMPQIERAGDLDSSIVPLNNAYLEFEEGCIRMTEFESRGLMFKVQSQTVENISNALLSESRIFQMADYQSDPAWMSRLKAQMKAETLARNAWIDYSQDRILTEVQRRLRIEGWDRVRPILSITVRYWFLYGYLEGHIHQNYASEVVYLRRAIALIEWGRDQWKDVPIGDRGVIFKDTFYQGVQNLYINALRRLCKMEKDVHQKTRLLDELSRKADELIANIDSNPIPPRRNALLYEAAFSTAANAYCMWEKIKMNRKRLGERKPMEGMEAAAEYLRAAQLFPTDDEYHLWYLNMALECMLDGGAPIRLLLQFIGKLKIYIPLAQKIWGQSTLAKRGRDKRVEANLQVETSLRKMLADGYKEEDVAEVTVPKRPRQLDDF